MFNFLSKLKNELSDKQKDSIKKIIRVFLSFLPINRNVTMLALKQGTDKWSHGYTSYYQKYFNPIRRKRLNILEIGVGGYKNPKSGGASLRMWYEYFPNSMIYSIDIHDKSYHEDRRIKIFRGSQNDPAFLKKVGTDIGSIDIIIDDGSHANEHVITSFYTLFPYLGDNGIYVIEDLQTSYWPQYGGNWVNLNESTTSVSMLKSLVDGLSYQYIPGRSPTYFDEHILSIHFYSKIVFIFKGKNKQILSKEMRTSLDRAKRQRINAKRSLGTL